MEKVKSRFHREVLEVKGLGERMGYGSMMNVACVLWRQMLVESGGPESGAFIPAAVYELKKRDLVKVEKEIKRVDKMIQELLKVDL